ncbi:MAG TPA: helix-turn-helix domain-containing protein [Gemmatimonadaceae bacterium]|jgi:DNA-binding MarR family transcriptional regulator
MPTNPSQQDLAIRLALAVKRIRARFHDAWPERAKALPISRIAILKRLRDDGPSTAASLANAEHVSQQAIAQHVAALRAAGLVKTAPDRADGRKILVSVTKSGTKLFEAAVESRNAWLARAIASEITPKEQSALAKAIDLLERLASADLATD